ncbi:Os04g0683750 [Oryza sativa Japonica Group]|uniref:Os04g0683750 protein n=1 Tax=Oryza sativa subsp. japonica TaxID=39947 RepID=C7J1Y8_ORYSJ|nr:Os04g0683750 [Oryza sativa Japonica Group]|eukprot:NP_001174149.1 Os04g0683750 [Oryza sativa Japonica Group]
MNRSAGYSASGFEVCRSMMIWWIVGTAVYHVAPAPRMSAQKVDAEKRPAAGSVTDAPDAREARRPQRRPWTWKSGSTITVASASVRRYTARMFWTDAARLRCVSGTPLGRLVVPEVCRNSATSDGSLAKSLAAAAAEAGKPARWTWPAASLRLAVVWARPSLEAAACAATLPSGLVMRRRAPESER